MYRTPTRPPRCPGAPRPTGRFPSPVSCWGFPGPRSPYGEGSPRGGPAHSPGSNRGHRDGSPARGFGGQMWRRGGGFRRPHTFSPNRQSGPSEASVEKYFSPAMLEDPWASLQPVDRPKS